MATENQEDLFEIKLTEVGRNYILKTARLAGGVVVLSILNSTISFLTTGIRVIRYTNRSYQYYTRNFFIADIVIMSIALLNIFAVLKYWSFISTARKGISNVNAVQFNQSFKFIYSNIVIAMVVIVLNIIILLFYFLQSIF
jgi:hypothetical protein